jgi:hypothetical protein
MAKLHQMRQTHRQYDRSNGAGQLRRAELLATHAKRRVTYRAKERITSAILLWQHECMTWRPNHRQSVVDDMRRLCAVHAVWMSNHPDVLSFSEQWAERNLHELTTNITAYRGDV